MRPLLLTISAFGSYANEQTIDFETGLNGQNFFLISGATGAGKTSILDAICYALYGETSSEGKNGSMLRSELADPKTKTYVEFTFSLGEKKYRVKRSPSYSIDGKKSNSTSAYLYEIRGNKSILINEKTTNVTKKLIEIIGFKSDQFRQVVVMPQGDFKKFLTASSKDREELLNIIFKTAFYREIAERLKSKTEQLNLDMQKNQKHLEVLLSGADAKDESEISAKISQIKNEIESATQNLQKLESNRKSILQKLHNANTLKQLLQNLAETLKKISEDSSKRETVKEYRQKLEISKRACEVREKETSAIQAKENLADKEYMAKKAAEEFEEISETFNRTKHAMEIATDESQTRQKLIMEIEQLKRYFELAGECKILEQKARTFAAKAVNTAKKYNQLSGDYDRANSDIEKIMAEDYRLRQIVSEEAKIVQILAEWQRRNALEQKHRDLSEVYASVEYEMNTKLKEIGIIRETLISERNKLEEMHRIESKERAAILAADLEEGEPCPVCGAMTHPFLAEQHEEIPSDEEFKHVEESIRTLEENLAHMEQQFQSVNDHLKKTKWELDATKVALDDLPTQEISFQQAAIERAKIVQAGEDLKKIARGLPILKQQLETIEKTREASQHERDDARIDAAKLQAEFLAKKSQIPARYQDIRTINEDLNRKEKELESSENAYKEAKSNFEDTQHQYTILDADCQTSRRLFEDAQKTYESMQADFLKSMSDAGFATREEYLAAISGDWGKAKYRDEVQSRIEKFEIDSKLHEAELERIRESIGDNAPKTLDEIESMTPNIQEIEHEYDASESEWKMATGSLETKKSELRNLEKTLNEIRRIKTDSRDADENFALAYQLSQIANGKEPPKKTSFQRYTLNALFRDVIDAANQRLTLMSQGRYFLRDSKVVTGNKSGGLELEVFDEFSGTARPTTTLSGGESFLAALALSLGMADVVGNQAGGIKLDTIFIDEGFGSLDMDTLDSAIKTLTELQSGGRLVGISSHVEELKNRIATRLEITKTNRGSLAHWMNI